MYKTINHYERRITSHTNPRHVVLCNPETPTTHSPSQKDPTPLRKYRHLDHNQKIMLLIACLFPRVDVSFSFGGACALNLFVAFCFSVAVDMAELG